MKSFMLAVSALVLLAFAHPSAAQMMLSGRPVYRSWGPAVVGSPYFVYGSPMYQYYPYPLPPAPSLGFGRGGIYGHVFVGRDETITSYTFPGRYQ